VYIRTVTRHNKDGSVATYVQLAHNVWDPLAKRATPQVLYSFGRAESVDKRALQRLARSVGRFLGPEEVLRCQAGLGELGLGFVDSRPMGGAWVLDQLWQQLGVGQVMARLLAEHQYQSPVERALFALVANRALAPRSKLAVEEWVGKETFIPRLKEVAVQQLYRAMDFLLEHRDEVQWQVYTSVANLLNLQVDLLFFDTTTSYFEVDEEDDDGTGHGFRRRGYSKDHRPDLPQAVIGLAVTREGIPVRCWVWPGSTADVTVVEQVKKDLMGWQLGRVITVVDRGFVSEDNLKELRKGGGHYIAGERMRSGKAGAEAALRRAGRYQVVKEGVEVKEIVVGEGEARERYVVVRNPKQAQRDRAKREDLLAKLGKGLHGLKGPGHSKACCALLSHPTYGPYLKQDRQGRPHIDREKVAREAHLDGKYLIRTSDDTLSAAEVALGYKQLAEVESAFRCLKQGLDLRPMYHRLEDRIRSHVLLCWLALLLVRVAENRTQETWRKLLPDLNAMHLGEFKGPTGRVLRRTESTPKQQRIFKDLGISEPPQVFLAEPSDKTPA